MDEITRRGIMVYPTALILRRALVLCVLLLTASGSFGQVSFSASFYNSDSSFSESVSVENANYDGVTILLPYDGFGDFPTSITSLGKGRSTDSTSSKFTHSVSSTTQGKSEGFSAKVEVESGLFDWQKVAKVSSDASSMAVGVNAMIDSGVLEAWYSNQNSALNEVVKTTNSAYSTNAFISPGLIGAKGQGESQSLDDCGFSSKIVAENLGKQVTMEASLTEESPNSEAVDHSWTDRTVLLPGRSSMEEMVVVESRDGWKIQPIPGYIPGSINTGMEFVPVDLSSGGQIFETQFVPRPGVLHINAIRVPFSVVDTHQTDELSMSANWRPKAG
jgi:hypothetical protein